MVSVPAGCATGGTEVERERWRSQGKGPEVPSDNSSFLGVLGSTFGRLKSCRPGPRRPTSVPGPEE